MNHPPPFAWAGYGLLFASAMFVVLCVFGWLPDSYFKAWSKSGDVTFFDDFRIDTPATFAMAALIVASNTVVSQLVGQTLGNYITNVVADHKAPRCEMGGNDFLIHMTVQTYYVYNSLAAAVRIFFLFSSFWFVVVQGISTAGVTYFVTRRRLQAKPDYEEYQRRGYTARNRYSSL